MRRSTAHSVIVAGLIAGLLIVGCAPLGKLVGRPSPELVGVNARPEVGLDYKVHVDCTVRNNGGAGDVTVFAELNLDGFWKKQQQVFVSEGEEKTVTLTFSEPSFLDGQLQESSYSCGL